MMKHIASDIQQRLPKSTEMGHPTGIVVAAGVELGENVQINQNVTLGTRTGNGYPVIEDNVKIYTGSAVLGDVTVGENSVIGANATVIEDVPADTTVVGTPARRV